MERRCPILMVSAAPGPPKTTTQDVRGVGTHRAAMTAGTTGLAGREAPAPRVAAQVRVARVPWLGPDPVISGPANALMEPGAVTTAQDEPGTFGQMAVTGSVGRARADVLRAEGGSAVRTKVTGTPAGVAETGARIGAVTGARTGASVRVVQMTTAVRADPMVGAAADRSSAPAAANSPVRAHGPVRIDDRARVHGEARTRDRARPRDPVKVPGGQAQGAAATGSVDAKALPHDGTQRDREPPGVRRLLAPLQARPIPATSGSTRAEPTPRGADLARVARPEHHGPRRSPSMLPS